MAPPRTDSRLLRLDKTIPNVAEIRDNLSAIVLHKNTLWLGSDEDTFVERLTRNADGSFGGHQRMDLAPLLDLPARGNKPPEIDIEGLDVDSGCLWVLGSHSAKREKPKPNASAAANMERLSQIERDGNRFTLGRVPLKSGPVAARLRGDEHGNILTRALAKDVHLGGFTEIPGKDNGLDLEGLAVKDDRIFLGMRGPVLRGWAVILELQVRESSSGRLDLAGVGGADHAGHADQPYRKHFLQLDGLGIRDLVRRGKDLLILAGPAMNHDGPAFVYRWRKALDQTDASLVWEKELEKILKIPFSMGKDRAEGICLESTAPEKLMVCYDSPAKSRCQGDSAVRVDVFAIG